jgi:hypothetical protein
VVWCPEGPAFNCNFCHYKKQEVQGRNNTDHIEIKKLGGIRREQGNLISQLLFFQNKENRLITRICQYDDDQSPEDSSRCYII